MPFFKHKSIYGLPFRTDLILLRLLLPEKTAKKIRLILLRIKIMVEKKHKHFLLPDQ